jgi:hypothetical protein
MQNLAAGFMPYRVLTHLIPSIVEREMKDFNCLQNVLFKHKRHFFSLSLVFNTL